MLRFSFELVTCAASVDLLLLALAEQLDEPDRKRVAQALPYRPALAYGAVREGIGGLALREYERANDVCFTFVFPPDSELVCYASEYEPPPTGGPIPVGCVYTKLHVGREHSLLTCTAATSSMSRVFERSPSVRDSWRNLAVTARSRALFFDAERDSVWDRLWPDPRTARRPELDAFSSEDFAHLTDVDAYCAAALSEG